jgi:hypothetical protein
VAKRVDYRACCCGVLVGDDVYSGEAGFEDQAERSVAILSKYPHLWRMVVVIDGFRKDLGWEHSRSFSVWPQ